MGEGVLRRPRRIGLGGIEDKDVGVAPVVAVPALVVGCPDDLEPGAVAVVLLVAIGGPERLGGEGRLHRLEEMAVHLRVGVGEVGVCALRVDVIAHRLEEIGVVGRDAGCVLLLSDTP